MYDIYARAAADVAREAGQFLKRFSDTRRLEVETKGGAGDFVTNADRGSQALISARLAEAFDSHRFIGEEDGLSDTEVARRLAGGRDGFFWICDPLDGTANYIRGLGVYAVSIGLVHRGRSVAGAICLPERDELFYAARGTGAFLNGAPVRASDCAELGRAFAGTDLPPSGDANRRRGLERLLRADAAVMSLRLQGSACAAIAQTACGRLDAYWNVGLHAWDVAAGIVILEEAGGAVSDAASNPFDFGMAGGFLGTAPGLRGAFRGVIEI